MGKIAKKPAITYICDISEAEYNRFVSVHGKVHRLEVPANDEFTEMAVCYLKPIERPFMSALLSVNDKVTRGEMMLTELWLAGDERIKKDDEMFYSALTSLNSLMTFRLSGLKKNYTKPGQ